MIEFTLWDIVRNLLLAARWTVLLSLIAFVGGGLVGLLILLARIDRRRWVEICARLYVELFQGTPLLMQLFILYFGFPLFGFNVSAWVAAAIALTLWTAAYLAEIWQGCVRSIAVGQWESAQSLGLRRLPILRLIIVPQALTMAIPPTVGFLVQVIKATALTSIIGFLELSKVAQSVAGATQAAFTVYGLVALIYFAICWPIAEASRWLERRTTLIYQKSDKPASKLAA